MEGGNQRDRQKQTAAEMLFLLLFFVVDVRVLKIYASIRGGRIASQTDKLLTGWDLDKEEQCILIADCD